ncbi:MAG: GWxTD domain-containing protein [Thermoanaerobaculia bacterium]|nr:GWxTD domain-containing protein [Thermoanaerobaculia bacterium]
MRSSSTCSAVARALASAALALACLAPPAQAAKKPPRYSAEEVTNFLLSPEHSLWLVGPVSWIATEKEIREYLSLTDDEAAEKFIREFWSSRRGDSASPWPDDQPAVVFARRAEAADNRFSESTSRGRHSDRGTIFILYGEPEDTFFQAPENRNRPPVEVWEYPKDAPPGLDGRQPKRRYYFSERDGKIQFANPVRPQPIRPF